MRSFHKEKVGHQRLEVMCEPTKPLLLFSIVPRKEGKMSEYVIKAA